MMTRRSFATEVEIPMELDLTINGPPPPLDETDMDESVKEMAETCQERMLRYAKMVLPHVGLVVLLTVYTILGAVIFHLMEYKNEEDQRSEYRVSVGKLERDFIEDLWNISQLTTLGRDQIRDHTKQFVLAMVPEIYRAYQTQLVSAEDFTTNNTRQIWTVEASIFFATTIITTIGRIFCIVFGLFGIPLLLVTIADIGKFLSDFLSFLYKTYRNVKRKIRKQSRRIYRHGWHNSSGSNTPDEKGTTPSISQDDQSEASSTDELRIPIVMVMLVLVSYTALGGFLFQMFEGWAYFDAFYFCFITMSTVGFGDYVPSEQMFMFITMAYIIVGLALATMCIDLAGTEYIRKIHYVGQKIETAKDVVGAGLASGLQVGEHLLKHTGYGFIRTAGGKLIHAGDFMRKGQKFAYPGMELSEEEFAERNILYEPISPKVAKLLKPHIKLRPEEISEKDGYILQNALFNRPIKAYHFSPEMIQRQYRPQHALKRFGSEPVLLIAPFVLKESEI